MWRRRHYSIVKKRNVLISRAVIADPHLGAHFQPTALCDVRSLVAFEVLSSKDSVGHFSLSCQKRRWAKLNRPQRD